MLANSVTPLAETAVGTEVASCPGALAGAEESFVPEPGASAGEDGGLGITILAEGSAIAGTAVAGGKVASADWPDGLSSANVPAELAVVDPGVEAVTPAWVEDEP